MVKNKIYRHSFPNNGTKILLLQNMTKFFNRQMKSANLLIYKEKQILNNRQLFHRKFT